MTTRAPWYPNNPPRLPGETNDPYTNRLTGADRTGRAPYDHRRGRQCSIGYHHECSDRDGNWREIQLELARDVVDTDEGQTITIHATGVVPVNPGERMKRYDLEVQLRDLTARHPGHTFTGTITCLGEEGDRWRYVVRDGKIVHETARVAWLSEGSDGLAQALARHIRVDFSDMTAGTPIVGVPYVIALAYGHSTSGITEPDREQLDHELAEHIATLTAMSLDRISAMAHRLTAAVDTERDKRLDQPT